MNTNKQTCPQCGKQLPVTASNCKYCGASLQQAKQPSIFDSLSDLNDTGKTQPLPVLTPNGPAAFPSVAPKGPAAPSVPQAPKVPDASVNLGAESPSPPTAVSPAALAASTPSSAESSDGLAEDPSLSDDWISDPDELSDLIDLGDVPESSAPDEPSDLIDLGDVPESSASDEPSDLIELGVVPEPSALIELDDMDDDTDDTPIVPDLSDRPSDDNAMDSGLYEESEDSDDQEDSGEKTVVAPMSDEVLEKMSAEDSGENELFTPSAEKSDILYAEGSDLIDLDTLEDPDDDVDGLLDDGSRGDIPALTDDATDDLDDDISGTKGLLADEPSGEHDPLDNLEDVDGDEDGEDSVPKSEKETVARKVEMPPSAPRASAPPRPVAARPSVPASGAISVPGGPSVRVSPSLAPAPPGTASVVPPSVSAPEVVQAPVPTAASPSAAAEPTASSTETSESVSSVSSSASSPAVDSSVTAPDTASASAPVSAPVSMDAPLDENTARIDAEEFQRTQAPSQIMEDEVESGISTQKIVIISVAAFVATMAIALGIMFATKEPNKIEMVDSSQLEPKPVSMNTEKPPAASVAAPIAADAATPEKAVPEEASPMATNCLPLARYYKKFPWKDQLAKLLENQGTTKVCELLGTDPSVVASVFEDTAVVGPTGYDWIVNGGRVEVFPRGTIGSREPSMEFMYANGKLFKIKLKYRNLKIGRFADADNLQKIFKKEDTRTDHLGRNAIVFDEQDMRVVLVEEEWYGQTLRTLEFSSVKFNEELAGHLQKLESLESVFKKAEAAYFGWKFDEALAGYEEVNSMAPGIGAAMVKRGLIHLRNDDFGNARKLAEDALENSAEDDVKAEAKGILAVNAMRNGNPEEAVAMLREALSMSPANERFDAYIEQLQSGEYSAKNIAQTAARLECIKEGKSEASELGVLARGFFPDKKVYQKNLKRVTRDKEFKETKSSLVAWECK